MLKVLTIVGTRPELIKMSSVIKTIASYTKHILVHTGQNYDPRLNQLFFDDLGIEKPKHYLDAVENSGSSAEAIASIIMKSDKVLATEKPDAIMLYGDTNSCLSVISAKKRKIPIFHMESGNRCFDQRVPEETNRKIVDHLSDINMTLTERAREYLIMEGLKPDRIFNVGSHMDEVIFNAISKIECSNILEGLSVNKGSFFLVSLHREENVDNPERLASLMLLIDQVGSFFGKETIVSLHPRTRLSLRSAFSDLRTLKTIRFVEPFSFTDYVFLQMNCYCLLSDSGTVSEESGILGIPAITLRYIHERPEGIEAGSFSLGSLSQSSLVQQIRLAVKTARHTIKYSDLGLTLSQRVSKLVLGYCDYINAEVWKKPVSSLLG